jgi:hypothetical protein
MFVNNYRLSNYLFQLTCAVVGTGGQRIASAAVFNNGNRDFGLQIFKKSSASSPSSAMAKPV